MADDELNRSFGVLKPVGHVVISFPAEQHSRRAAQELVRTGTEAEAVRYFSDREMMRLLDADLADASPLAEIGQEVNLAKFQRALAAKGYHFLIVRANDDEHAKRIAEAVKPYAAERAQYYGHFVIEELIEHAGDGPQVFESPDRGIDAPTPSDRASNPLGARRDA
ncbi:MAG: hypothetical protein ABI633_05270 [Burkholderiales bacterium]